MNRATGAASLSVAAMPHKRRHHRHKRFHRPREALGLGFERFDVKQPDSPPDTAAATASPNSEPKTDPEKKQLISRRGMRNCALILLVVFAVYHYKWVWHIYLTAMRAWPDLHWH